MLTTFVDGPATVARLSSTLLIQLADLMMRRGNLVCSVLVPGPCFVLE